MSPSLIPAPTRRSFFRSHAATIGSLAAGGAIGKSLWSADEPTTNPLPAKGWHPDRLSTSVLSLAQTSMARIANKAYDQQLTSNHLLSGAENLWALHKHLHEVGFHTKAFDYIKANRHSLVHPNREALRASYETMQENTGLEVPFDTLWGWRSTHVTDGSVLSLHQQAKRENGISAIGRKGAQALGYLSRKLPASAAQYRRLREYERVGRVIQPEPDRVRLRRAHYFQDCLNGDSACSSDQYLDGGYWGGWDNSPDGGEESVFASPTLSADACWYLQVAGLYVSIVGIPMATALAAIPVLGWVLVVAGISIIVTGLLFNC